MTDVRAAAGFAAGLGLGLLSYSRGWLIVVDWILYAVALVVLLYVLFVSPQAKKAELRRRRAALARVPYEPRRK